VFILFICGFYLFSLFSEYSAFVLVLVYNYSIKRIDRDEYPGGALRERNPSTARFLGPAPGEHPPRADA
jgi:hypothetical protein